VEIDHCRIGSGCKCSKKAAAHISSVRDNYDFHRTADVSQIEKCFDQVHFLASRNKYGGIKIFAPDLIDRSPPIGNLCDLAPGADQAPFDFLTSFRTNQQGFFKASEPVTTETKNIHRSVSRSVLSGESCALK